MADEQNAGGPDAEPASRKAAPAPQEIVIGGPDCAPMVISIKNGPVAIVIRMGKGSENLSAFGVKPRAPGGIQALDGGDPAGGPGCP